MSVARTRSTLNVKLLLLCCKVGHSILRAKRKQFNKKQKKNFTWGYETLDQAPLSFRIPRRGRNGIREKERRDEARQVSSPEVIPEFLNFPS